MIIDEQQRPLAQHDRELIRVSLRELARASLVLVLGALAAPSLTSLARTCANSPLNLQSKFGPKLFKSACNSVALSVTAAADNVDLFVSSLRTERATVSMAALTRAAAEAYGRAFFLLKAPNDADFFHRYVSLTHEELKYPEKHSGLVDSNRFEIDGVAYRTELAAMGPVLGFEKLRDVGLGRLVSEVLDPMVDGAVDLAISAWPVSSGRCAA